MKKLFFVCLSLVAISNYSQTINLQNFATGFSSPVEIVHPANDSRLFVVQQGGIIKILNPNGSINATPFLTLTTATITTGGERGLLGMAFHPNYASNGFFYLNYTNTSGNTVVARYAVNASNPNIANTIGTVLLTVNQPFANHNGGGIHFGPDGYLYIGMGDGGSGGDPGNRAQNINENLGKMLRIDVDSASPYGIPPTNPYVGVAGNDEIWAIGVRNPWKFSFNRLNGDLWIADVGQNVVEEINKIPSPLPNTGLNFGWRCYEGNVAYNTTGCVPLASMTAPIAVVNQNTGACSITGGYVYTGSLYPNLQGKYLFSDYCNPKIGMVSANGAITFSQSFDGNSFVSFGEDINGELYIADIGSGKIYKIIDTSDTSMGIDNFTKNGLSLYPNPAKTEFFIRNSGELTLSKMQLFDLSGKLLVSKRLDGSQDTAVAVGDLTSGLYLITVEDTVGNLYKSKFVKE
jgi:glucose/arabinose dehydrogenase